jgi:hypothetical protein
MSLSPLKAIRAHCVDCSGHLRAEVRRCPVANCPLFPFRMGRNPNRRRAEKSNGSVDGSDGQPSPPGNGPE